MSTTAQVRKLKAGAKLVEQGESGSRDARGEGQQGARREGQRRKGPVPSARG